MKKTKLTRSLLAACSIVALSAVMYGCVHSGDDPVEPPVVTPEPHACDAGASQACVDARQAELDALGDDATVAEVRAAQAALAAAQTDLAAVRAAAARQALIDAAMCTEGTQACVDAHQALVDALAADPTTTVPELAAARAGLANAQMAKAEADAAAAAAAARQALVDAAAMCTAGTAECVAAHQALVNALEADDTTSDADLAAARANLAAVQMAKSEADAVAARQALVDAAMCMEGTQACVDAHQALVDALDADPSTSADDLQTAKDNLASVQMAKDEADAARTAAETRQALVDAAMCMDATQECVDAHQALVDALDADPTTSADDLQTAKDNLASVTMAKNEADAMAAAVAADMETVNGAITAATNAIAGLTAMSSKDDVEAARMAVMAAQDALDGVENLDDAQTASLQAMIDAIDTDNLVAQETRIAMADEMARVAAETKAAGTKEAAIAAEASQGPGQTPANPDAGLGGSARTDADGTTTPTDATDDVYGLSISRDRDGTEIMVTDPAMAGDDDPKFVQAMGDNSFSMQTRTMEADDDGNVVSEVVMVRTDIEGPRGVAFAMVTGQALNADLDTATDANNDGTADNDLTGLWVGDDGSTAPTEAQRGNVMSSAFAAASGDSVVHTFARYQLDSDGTTDGNQTIQAFTAPGTYNGAMGTYRCGNVQTAADCTVTVDDEGMITAMSVGWIFTPDAGATSDVADADYLHYGFWLKRTTDSDDMVEYNEVETFAGSSVPPSGDVSSVLGTATYEGGATGVYVHAVMNPDGTRASATSGHFNADAVLMATFGQVPVSDTDTTGTIAPSLLNTLTGTINNFMLSDHDTGPGWSVSLEQSAITTSAGTFSGVAKGGGADGTYSGTFHGDVTAVDGVVPHPGSAVGEFNANFSNGAVAGAFGARKED